MMVSAVASVQHAPAKDTTRGVDDATGASSFAGMLAHMTNAHTPKAERATDQADGTSELDQEGVEGDAEPGSVGEKAASDSAAAMAPMNDIVRSIAALD